jgi:hypothetical protein
MHCPSFNIFLQHLSHNLQSLFNWGSFSVIQGNMFLKLFLSFLCVLSLNGLQHIALVVQDAIIVVNSLNQQNLLHKVIICYQRKTFRTCEYLICLKNQYYMIPAQTCQCCRDCLADTHQLNTKWCKSGISGYAKHVQLFEFCSSRYVVCCSNLKCFPIFFRKLIQVCIW